MRAGLPKIHRGVIGKVLSVNLPVRQIEVDFGKGYRHQVPSSDIPDLAHASSVTQGYSEDATFTLKFEEVEVAQCSYDLQAMNDESWASMKITAARAASVLLDTTRMPEVVTRRELERSRQDVSTMWESGPPIWEERSTNFDCSELDPGSSPTLHRA